MLSINELKKGKAIKLNGEPYEVLFSQHLKMGRGGGMMQTKLKNLLNGGVLEKNFKGGEQIEEAELTRVPAQFLYHDDAGAYFMEQKDFATLVVEKANAEEAIPYLKEGQPVWLLLFETRPVSIDMPVKVDLKVVSTPPGAKGDTASGGATKKAKLETGLELQVPLFINQGDTVKVNTETGEYIERVN